jgi:hypothetical protein
MEQPKNNQKPGLSWSTPSTSATPAKPAVTPIATTPLTTALAPLRRGSSAPWYAGIFVVGVVIGVVGMWAFSPDDAGPLAANNATSTTQQKNNAAAAELSATSPLTVPASQKSGTTVVVAGLTVEKPTWVVVYEDRAGKPGNVLGAKLFTGGGSGTVTLLRGTTAGRTYYVGLATDNGDRKYSKTKDAATMNADGSLVTVTFTAN